MLVKWGIAGAILGALLVIKAGQPNDIIPLAAFGSLVLIGFRKWIFRKLWM